jgi:hypothetical protein
MKKLLLILSVVFLSSAKISAQTCTPGANYADSTYGVWPDTVQNIPPAFVGVPYSTDLNFKVPNVVTAELAGDDPTAQLAIGNTIQSFTVTGVTGLPATFDYGCNISSCTYNGGSNGCANLYGTASATGVFPITINVSATILFPNPLYIPNLTPEFIETPQATSFSGYKLIVGTAGLAEGILNPIEVHPNPAKEAITISGLYAQLNIGSFVITNTEGKIMKTITPSSNSVDVTINDLSKGMYYVVVNHSAGKEVVKFIKE